MVRNHKIRLIYHSHAPVSEFPASSDFSFIYLFIYLFICLIPFENKLYGSASVAVMNSVYL